MAGVSSQATINAQGLPLASSADETLGPWVDVRGLPNVTAYLQSSGTTSSGVVSFEEMAPATVGGQPFGASTGNYSVISTANASDFTGGAQKAYHLPEAAYTFVRMRISTAIGGGGSISGTWVAY
jgi:hypothetical protein